MDSEYLNTVVSRGAAQRNNASTRAQYSLGVTHTELIVKETAMVFKHIYSYFRKENSNTQNQINVYLTKAQENIQKPI